MSRIEAAVLACRILAVYALLQSFWWAALFSEWLFALIGGRGGHFGGMQAGFPVTVLGSVLLWTCAGYVGTRMADFQTRPLPDSPRVAPPQLLAIGLTLVGVLDLLTSVPLLFNLILEAALAESAEYRGSTGWGGTCAGLAANALRVALGIGLVLGGRGLANAVRGLRLVGLEPHEQPGAACRGLDETPQGGPRRGE